jgi:hypothetical protein
MLERQGELDLLGDVSNGKDITGSTTHDSSFRDSSIGTYHQSLPLAKFQQLTSDPKNLRSLTREMTREELMISFKPPYRWRKSSHLDPSPTFFPTMLCYAQTLHSGY